MPNALAYLMLLIWPLVSVMLFRRLPAERAIIWCILGGYLVLPPLAEFDLPLVPDMDKHAIPSIMAFVLCVFMLKKPVPIMPRSWVARILVIIFMLGTIPTVLNNTDPLIVDVIHNSYPIQITATQLPGLTLRDVGSVVINQIILLLPFFLARQYLSTDHGMRELLLALVVGALAYSLPAMFEVRFSPQLNIWIYGFFQHDFGQMIRQGGFRPIVFLPHALWLAFFMLSALLAATALARTAAGTGTAHPAGAGRWPICLQFWCCAKAWPRCLCAGLCPGGGAGALALAAAGGLAAGADRGGLPDAAQHFRAGADRRELVAQAEADDQRRAGAFAELPVPRTKRSLLARAEEKAHGSAGAAGAATWCGMSRPGRSCRFPDGRWIIVIRHLRLAGLHGRDGAAGAAAGAAGLCRAARKPAGIPPHRRYAAADCADPGRHHGGHAAERHPDSNHTWMCAGAVLGYVERLKEQSLIRAPALFAADASGPVIGCLTRPGRRRKHHVMPTIFPLEIRPKLTQCCPYSGPNAAWILTEDKC